MSGDKAQINVKVPKETKRLAKNKLGHGGLSDEIRDTLKRIAHGEVNAEKDRVKDRLEELRDKREDEKRKKANIETKLSDINRKIERLENKLDSIRDKEGEYKGMLQMIESDYIEQGRNVFPEHKIIQDASEKANCSGEDVIKDLKDRNPNVPTEQFERGANYT